MIPDHNVPPDQSAVPGYNAFPAPMGFSPQMPPPAPSAFPGGAVPPGARKGRPAAALLLLTALMLLALLKLPFAILIRGEGSSVHPFFLLPGTDSALFDEAAAVMSVFLLILMALLTVIAVSVLMERYGACLAFSIVNLVTSFFVFSTGIALMESTGSYGQEIAIFPIGGLFYMGLAIAALVMAVRARSRAMLR
ncbi:MAG: hypothetical protein HFJ80_03370 [Clostridiales bacterium]|nr:hypothetical protein [Clostridiales bacterium]